MTVPLTLGVAVNLGDMVILGETVGAGIMGETFTVAVGVLCGFGSVAHAHSKAANVNTMRIYANIRFIFFPPDDCCCAIIIHQM